MPYTYLLYNKKQVNNAQFKLKYLQKIQEIRIIACVLQKACIFIIEIMR